MTTRIDFYLIDNPPTDAFYTTVCRIINKAYLQSHKIYVYCSDDAQTQTMDKLLWTFQDISFLPHQIQQQDVMTDIPIVLGDISQSIPISYCDILVNLTTMAPKEIARFQRVIEVISADTQHRAQARERYKNYREQGYSLHSHQLS